MSLLSALYTGVSGLQTFGDSLQVIGDNIANVNTTSFKSARAEFSDVLSQSINVASGRSQLGRGVTLNRISSNFAQGSFSNTDRLTDLAINGNGFFVVNDGTSDFYTRNGQFTINNQGNLVTANGMTLQGYQYDSSGQALGTLGPLQINQSATQPKITGSGVNAAGTADGSGITLAMNLNASDPVKNAFTASNPAETSNFNTSTTVYDSQGQAHEISVYFNKTANNTWGWHALVDAGEVGGTAGTFLEGMSGTMSFDTNGIMTGTTTNASSTGFNFTGTAQKIGFNFGSPTGNSQNTTTQFASPDVIHAQSQDGFGAGSLSTVAVGEDGVITGTYSNGLTRPIGQLALANFADLQGLHRAGSGIYTETSESGVPVINRPNVGGYGSISSYSLELSNVDLATEFVSLISTQRAYQANSKIITVGDQLLSEIVQIIR